MSAAKSVTIVITPRDRYSELSGCIDAIYRNTDEQQFDLLVLDLGYPKSDIEPAQKALANHRNYRILNYGRIIPMAAMDRVRAEISTKYTVFMDNDSRVTEGWLGPLLDTAETTSAAVVNPVTLERAGVDSGAELRNHLYTNELRIVDIEEKSFLIEHKTFRRSLPDEIPQLVSDTQSFELHCAMFNTEVLKSLEMPRMTIREHLDIGLQLKALNKRVVVDPRSKIIFDNLGTRAKLSDLKYFNLRWNSKVTWQSSRLFEKRWGYKFYSEEAIYNWAIRRRLFLFLRWMYLPIGISNMIDRIFFSLRRRFFPIWDPIKDPLAVSRPLYEELPGGTPRQLSHSTVV